MLSDDNHPGIFTFMVGMILVVLAGVGLSLLVDCRFSFSRWLSGMRNETQTGETELAELRGRHQNITQRLAGLDSMQQRMAEEHESRRRQVQSLEQRQTNLKTSRNHLQTSIQAIVVEFTRYRANYRAMVWAKAAGMPLGDLVTRDGRQYRQAVIVRVTDVGLEIRHAEGTARVQAPNLDPALQARLQWNDKERKARLQQELAQDATAVRDLESTVTAGTKADTSVRFPDESALAEAEKLRLLQAKVRTRTATVMRLTAESEKAYEAAMHTKSPIPGSLETWRSRATRLANELSKARAELAAAQAALAALDPHDPLLGSESAGF